MPAADPQNVAFSLVARLVQSRQPSQPVLAEERLPAQRLRRWRFCARRARILPDIPGTGVAIRQESSGRSHLGFNSIVSCWFWDVCDKTGVRSVIGDIVYVQANWTASVLRDSRDQPGSEVAVIILNYRTPDLVVGCLASLAGQLSAGQHEAVVLDNCSGDGSAEAIRLAIRERGWGSWARVVESPRNGGFAAGNNAGIAATEASVYVLLNSDTIVRPGAIAALVDFLDNDRVGVGLVGPRLEWPDGEAQISTFRYRTPFTELIRASRSGWLGRRLLGHVVARPMDRLATDLDWISFACVAVKREVFERVGPLDERYFMYYEDMDYCRRAREKGYRIAYQPAAKVVHLRGGSSEVKRHTIERKRRPRYYYAARSRYFWTWYGPLGLLAANVLRTLGWLLAMPRGKSGSVEREWLDIWTRPAVRGPGPATSRDQRAAEPIAGGRATSA